MSPAKQKILKQHFTDADEIRKLMCQLLGDVENLEILEPSIGHGAFLSDIHGVPSRIDAVDVDEDALSVVRNRFKSINIKTYNCDFIDAFVGGKLFPPENAAFTESKYDAVISNPPYGLYFDIAYRRKLKSIYPDFYVRESFGLFFMLSVNRLREDGKYVFLLPDTFLSSKNHTPLRRFIEKHAAPTHIIRFSSRRFETVNFGYGKLCIIAGQKKAISKGDEVNWVDFFDEKKKLSMEEIKSHESSINCEALINCLETGWSFANLRANGKTLDGWTTLGALAECRTGIYTGDNSRFIGYDPERINRRLNGHPINWSSMVNSRELSDNERANGLIDKPFYVPLIRGGHRDCFDLPSSAINWSKSAVDFYRTDKKARLQNSKFYFKPGISVPMVSTGRISAALMDSAVFDQGVVGVFPYDEKLKIPLLLYINSKEASRQMKSIVNGGANNSANYLKRLPVPVFSDKHISLSMKLYSEAVERKKLSPDACDQFVREVIKELPAEVAS